MTNDNSPVGDEYHSSEFESDKAASDVRRPLLVLLPELSLDILSALKPELPADLTLNGYAA